MMNKRVFGVIGISAKMSLWNADFSGYPRTMSSGQIFSTDKPLKWMMKQFWEMQNLVQSGKSDILTLRSYLLRSGKLAVRKLEERYEYLTGEKCQEGNAEKILKNLFTMTDVRQFGFTFAVGKLSMNSTGAVSIGQGLNQYQGTEVLSNDILSPYQSDEKKSQASVGNQILTDEAHYVFPMSVNPMVYRSFEALGVTNGYTEEDLARLKEACTQAVNCYHSCARSNCANEFFFVVETDLSFNIPAIETYVQFVNGEDGGLPTYVVDVDTLVSKYGSHIQNMECYYNPKLVQVEGLTPAVNVVML